MLLDTTLPEIFVFLCPVENILNYIRDKTAGCGQRFASGDGRLIIYQMCPTRKKYLSLVLHYFNIPPWQGTHGPSVLVSYSPGPGVSSSVSGSTGSYYSVIIWNIPHLTLHLTWCRSRSHKIFPAHKHQNTRRQVTGESMAKQSENMAKQIKILQHFLFAPLWALFVNDTKWCYPK